MPRPIQNSDTVQSYVRFPKTLREALEEARKRQHWDFVVLMEQAAMEWLKKHHPDLVPPASS